MNEAVEVMAEEGENEVNSPITQQPHQHSISTSSAAETHQRKRSRKDPLVEVVAEIGSSLKEYCSSVKEYFTAKKNQEQPQPSCEEIHAVVSKVSGLTRLEIFKIVEKLMHGGAEDFKFLKSLSNDDDKKEWI
nr:hypothetical protein CFP56_55268 [Quercus suber]